MIWHHPWVPTKQRINRPTDCPVNINCIADLIDHQTLQWKNQLVVQETRTIKRIPIAP